MSDARCWKLLLTGDTAGLAFAPLHDCSIHPAHYERVLVVEAAALDALRARVAELEALVRRAYREAWLNDDCVSEAQAWQDSLARAALLILPPEMVREFRAALEGKGDE